MRDAQPSWPHSSVRGDRQAVAGPSIGAPRELPGDGDRLHPAVSGEPVGAETRALLPITYVLPLRADGPDPELDAYLHRLSREVDDLIVVDGSAPEVYEGHDRRWPEAVRHLRPEELTPMGKVGNALTGLAVARHELVVIADDDVRWTPDLLQRAIAAMGDAGVARPQNRFVPAPWPARWDTGRILLHRALGGDWPGTLLVRRAALPRGYAGDALFENLELVRTVRADGWREQVLLDVVVDRRPATTAKFVEQRVREAYDEWARPGYLLAELALLPAVLRWRGKGVATVAAGAVGLAAIGRRRAGGAAYWPATAPLWAPAWLAERAFTSWCALGLRLVGGARFGGSRLPLAAHSLRRLRAAHHDRSGPERRSPRCHVASGRATGGPAGPPVAPRSTPPADVAR